MEDKPITKPKFITNGIEIKKMIGSGAFGSVYQGKKKIIRY